MASKTMNLDENDEYIVIRRFMNATGFLKQSKSMKDTLAVRTRRYSN